MYIIVHAGYITDQEFSEYRMRGGKCRKSRTTFFIWARDESVYYGRNDSTIIFGHTPTIARESLFYNDGKVWYHEDERKNCRFFNIDCGLVWGKLYPEDKGNLACIRLEDEKVFYLYG